MPKTTEKYAVAQCLAFVEHDADGPVERGVIKLVHWRKPEAIRALTQYHTASPASPAARVVLLLVLASRSGDKGIYRGYYHGGAHPEFRMEGSQGSVAVLWWSAMPEMPS